MLAIYVLSHNRPQFILQCVHSVLKATSEFDEVDLFVSDNSPNDNVVKILNKSSLRVNILRRERYMTGIKHINHCIAEAREKRYSHVCVFHDDDIMMKDFVKETINAIKRYPTKAAVCFNIASSKKTSHGTISIKNDIISSLFAIGRNEIIPFPSFTYNLKVIGEALLDESIGKHCDVEFLLRVAEYGDIAIINSPQIKTRIHSNSDSYNESIRDRRKLLNAILRNYQLPRAFFKSYRIAYILRKKRLNRCNIRLLQNKRFIPYFWAHLIAYAKSIIK